MPDHYTAKYFEKLSSDHINCDENIKINNYICRTLDCVDVELFYLNNQDGIGALVVDGKKVYDSFSTEPLMKLVFEEPRSVCDYFGSDEIWCLEDEEGKKYVRLVIGDYIGWFTTFGTYGVRCNLKL